LLVSPTSLRTGSGIVYVQGIFWYVDPNAHLSTGILLTTQCGQGSQKREQISFESVDIGLVGALVVQLPIDTNCDLGEYSTFFLVIEEKGNASNQIEIRYSLTSSD
jgi:hypothetical protein